MKLYFSPGACSLSPHIVALEADLPCQLEQVDLRTKKTAGGADFIAINPKGYVPALELDDGSILTEGPAIVQYLADLAPAKNLAPAAGTLARYQVMEWLNFISTEIHKNYSPLFRDTSSADMKAAAHANLGKRYDYVESKLAGRSYLSGEQFCVADAYLFTVTNWAGMVGVDLSAWPLLQAFQARVAARPAVQAAMRAQGLLK